MNTTMTEDEEEDKKLEKLMFGKMIDKGSEGVLFVPIKVYDVESKIASKYGGGNFDNVTASSVPVTQEVVVQTTEAGISQGTQTEPLQRTSASTNPGVEGEPTQKSLCAKPLRELIEELATLSSDEDTANDDAGIEANRKQYESGNLSEDLEEVLGRNIIDKKQMQGQIGESYEMATGSKQIYGVEEVNTPKSREMQMSEKVLEYDELTGKYRCSGCDKLFKTAKSHKKVACWKSKTFDVNLFFDEETHKYKCDSCEKAFTSKTSFLNHKRNICNKAPQHECIFCDFKGRSPIVVRVHCGKKHGKWPRLLKSGIWVYE